MKKPFLLPAKLAFIFCFLLLGTDAYAQFNNGMGQRGMGRNGMGRQRSAIPQAEHTPEPEAPKTAEELVNEQMPSIITALELNDFESAVMSSILKKYLQERIELQILKLPPEKMKEAYIKLSERQIEEIKAGLPPEKYAAFEELQDEGLSKALKKKKKKSRKERKNKG